MRYLILALPLCLTACHKPAEPPPTSASATAPVAADDGWNGKYEGDLRIEITGPAGAHQVSLLAATQDCTGDIGLADKGVKAITDGANLIVDAQVGQDACKVTLSRDGDKVTAVETSPCTAFHGATCSFNGTAMRIR